MNIPNLIQILLGGTIPMYNSAKIISYPTEQKSRLKASKFLLMGDGHRDLKRHTDPRDKWYTPTFMFKGKTFPKYLHGTAYLMSSDTAHILYTESLKTSILHLEDVYLTGIVANKVGIERIHHPLMTLMDFDKNDMCRLHGLIHQHKLTSADMYKAFDFVTNLVNNCPISEVNFVASFFHNIF